MQALAQDEYFDENVLQDNWVKCHDMLNFYLPHEYGGVGHPYKLKNLYELFNIFSDKMDLAVIKPRYTTKNEFKIELPRNELLDA